MRRVSRDKERQLRENKEKSIREKRKKEREREKNRLTNLNIDSIPDLVNEVEGSEGMGNPGRQDKSGHKRDCTEEQAENQAEAHTDLYRRFD